MILAKTNIGLHYPAFVLAKFINVALPELLFFSIKNVFLFTEHLNKTTRKTWLNYKHDDKWNKTAKQA